MKETQSEFSSFRAATQTTIYSTFTVNSSIQNYHFTQQSSCTSQRLTLNIAETLYVIFSGGKLASKNILTFTYHRAFQNTFKMLIVIVNTAS